MIHVILCAAIFFAMPVTAQVSVQHSHIEANVPSAEVFAPLLQRDLLAFVRANGTPNATRVEYTLLRDAPTQSGMSYPKFYAWVKVLSNSNKVSEGAVRLAAVDRHRFDVTNYLTAQQIRGNPGALHAVFPKALVPGIIQRSERK